MTLTIPESELEERFIRAPGPGGQNVNKVATAVQLRFDVKNSTSLCEFVRRRLVELAGSRMTDEGVLVITASTHRSQERNRAEARARLADLVQRASIRRKVRRATKPSVASRERRLNAKTSRSRIKGLRKAPVRDEG